MAMPAAATPADQPDRPAGWVVLTASERGASHVAAVTPNQDSVAVERAGADGVVTAVADGHGHSRHSRSARGSRLAVGIGCRIGQELADQLVADGPAESAEPGSNGSGAAIAASRITELVHEFVIPEVVQRWRAAVLDDVAKDPFTDSEEERRRPGDDPTIAYGSTLLLCLALRDWLIFAQIGDGDVVGVRTDGTATMPIPADPQLDGLVTTSLCGPDAAGDFRVAVVNVAQTPLLAALLATDGYGNAQIVEQWPASFSKDLAWLLRERDTRWIASQLPTWAARCASAEGSADDTTVSLLIAPAAQAARTMMPPGSAGGVPGADLERDPDEITIPAVIRSETVPSGQVPGAQGPTEPITVQLQATKEAQSEPGATEPVTAESVPADQETTDPVIEITEQITTEWEPPGRSAGSGVR